MSAPNDDEDRPITVADLEAILGKPARVRRVYDEETGEPLISWEYDLSKENDK